MTARARTTCATALRFRPGVYEALGAAASEHDVSINWLVNKACEEFLTGLLPADQIRWTRPPEPTVTTKAMS